MDKENVQVQYSYLGLFPVYSLLSFSLTLSISSPTQIGLPPNGNANILELMVISEAISALKITSKGCQAHHTTPLFTHDLSGFRNWIQCGATGESIPP